MKISSSIKIIIGAVATVFLGALGSGLWERFLSPFFDYLADSITRAASSLSSSYADSIYERASTLEHSGTSEAAAWLLLFFAVLWLFIYGLGGKKETEIVSVLHKAFTRQAQSWVGIILSGAYLLVIFFMLSTSSSIQQVRMYSVKNMEIVRPYILPSEYLLMRSEYMQIKSRTDFDRFLESLYEKASANSIEITKFDKN